MSNQLDIITAALQKYVVSPLAAFGVGGYVFDIAGDSIAALTSDITDHYTEDNRALQDHIAIRPKRITLRGYVGELVYRLGGQDKPFLQKVPQKLITASAYLPQLSSAAQQIQQVLSTGSITSVSLSSASDIYSMVKNSLSGAGDESAQQNAYTYFRTLQEQGVLMGIQTPWEFLSNMAIESIIAIQPEATRYVTDFAVTFKEIRIAASQTFAFTFGNTLKQGAAALQGAPEVAIGQVPGLNLPYSGLPGKQSDLSSGADWLKLRGIWEYTP